MKTMNWPLSRMIAHRGAPRLAPENTIAALTLCAKQGAHSIECDIQLTQDYVPIIFHDSLLSRTTNGHGAVSHTFFSHIQTLDAGSWFSNQFAHEPVPTLTQWLQSAATHQLAVNLELKSETQNVSEAKILVNSVLRELRQWWPAERAALLLSSFNRLCFETLIAECSDYPIAFNSRTLLSPSQLNDFITVNHFLSVHHPAAIITQSYIDYLHEKQLHVLAYTVNDRKQAAQLIAMGIDGMFTDNHELYDL